jgi:hypothetical protein
MEFGYPAEVLEEPVFGKAISVPADTSIETP